MQTELDDHYTRVYYYSAFNSFYWLCALSFFIVLFVSFFFRLTGPMVFFVPSILTFMFLFLCLFATASTCSLPAYRVFYYRPVTTERRSSIHTTTDQDFVDTKEEPVGP